MAKVKVILIDNEKYVKSFLLNSVQCIYAAYANNRYYVTIFCVGSKNIEFTLTSTNFNKASLQNMEDCYVAGINFTIAVYEEHLVTLSEIKETDNVIDYIDDLEGTERWIRGKD